MGQRLGHVDGLALDQPDYQQRRLVFDQRIMTSLLSALVHLGAIQFGQFQTGPGSRTLAPLAIHLDLLPSYPAVLRHLAQDLTRLLREAENATAATHLLTTPATTPVGVALSLEYGMPLVYPAPGDPQTIAGAYDFNVPTVLLTGVLSDGAAERALIRRVRALGLDVKALIAVLDLRGEPVGPLLPFDDLPVLAWCRLLEALPAIEMLTPSMRQAVQAWLIRG